MCWFSCFHSWFYSLPSIGNIFACYFFQILFLFFLSSSLEPPTIWKRGCLKPPHRPLMGLFDLCVCPSFFLSVSFWIVSFAMFSSSFEMFFPKYHFLCHVSSTTNLIEYIFLLSRQSFHRWEFGKGLGFLFVYLLFICSDMHGPRQCHGKWGKPDGERQIPYDITSTWNLKTGYAWTYLQNRNRVTGVENKFTVTRGEAGAGGETGRRIDRNTGSLIWVILSLPSLSLACLIFPRLSWT